MPSLINFPSHLVTHADIYSKQHLRGGFELKTQIIFLPGHHKTMFIQGLVLGGGGCTERLIPLNLWVIHHRTRRTFHPALLLSTGLSLRHYGQRPLVARLVTLKAPLAKHSFLWLKGELSRGFRCDFLSQTLYCLVRLGLCCVPQRENVHEVQMGAEGFCKSRRCRCLDIIWPNIFLYLS